MTSIFLLKNKKYQVLWVYPRDEHDEWYDHEMSKIK